MDTTTDDVTPDLQALSNSHGPPPPCTGDTGHKHAPNGFGSSSSMALAGMASMGLTVDDLLDMDVFCSGTMGSGGGMSMGMMGMDVDAGPVSFSTAAPPSSSAAAAGGPGDSGDQQHLGQFALNKFHLHHSSSVLQSGDAFNLTSHLPLDLEPPLPPLPPAIPFFASSSLSVSGSFSQPLPHPASAFHHSFPPPAPTAFSQPLFTRPSTAPSTTSSTSSSSSSTNTSTSPSSIPPSPTPESTCSSSSSTISQHSTRHPSPANAPPSASAIDYRFTTFSPIASPVQAASRHVSPPPTWDLQDSHPPSAFFPAAAAAAAATAQVGPRRKRYATDGEMRIADTGASPVVDRLLDEKRQLLELLHTRFTASEIHNWAYSANISLSTNANDPLYSPAPRKSHSTSLPSPPVSISTPAPMSPGATSWSQPFSPPPAPAAPPSLIIRIRKPPSGPLPDPPSSASPAPVPAARPPPPLHASHVLARRTYSIPTAAAALPSDDDSDALSSMASDYDDSVAAKINRKKGKIRGAAKTAAATAASAANAKRRREERERQRQQAQVDAAAVLASVSGAGGARGNASGAGRGRGRGRGKAPRSIEGRLAAAAQAGGSLDHAQAKPSSAASGAAPAPGRGRGRGRGRPARGGARGGELGAAATRKSGGFVQRDVHAVPTAADAIAGLPPLPTSPAVSAAAVKPDEREMGSAARKRRVAEGDLGEVSRSGRKPKRQRRASYDSKIVLVEGGLADQVDDENEEVDVVRLEQVTMDIGPVQILGSDLETPIMRLPSPPPDIFRSRGLPALPIEDALAAAAATRVQGHDQRSRRGRCRQKGPPASSAKVCLPRNVRAAARSVQFTPAEDRCAQPLEDESRAPGEESVTDFIRTASSLPAAAQPHVDSQFAPTPAIHNEPHAYAPPEPPSASSSPLSSHLSAYISSSSRPSTPSTSLRVPSPSESPLPTPSSSSAPSTVSSETPTTSLGTRWTRADRLLLCAQWLAAADPADLVARLTQHFPTRSKRACRHQLDDLIHGRVTCEGVDVNALKNRRVRGYVDPRYEGPGGRKRSRGGPASRDVEAVKKEVGGASPSPRKVAEIVVMVPPVQAGHLQVLRKRLSSMTQAQNGAGAVVKVERGLAAAAAAEVRGNDAAVNGVVEAPALNARAAADAAEDVMMDDASNESESAARELSSIQGSSMDEREDGMLVDDGESRPILELVALSRGGVGPEMQLNPSPDARCPLTLASTSTSSEPQSDSQDVAPYETDPLQRLRSTLSPTPSSELTSSPVPARTVAAPAQLRHEPSQAKPYIDPRPTMPAAISPVNEGISFPQAAGGVPCSEPDLSQHRPRSPSAPATASVQAPNSSPLPTRGKVKKQRTGPIRPHTALPPPPLSSVSSSGSTSRAARPAAAAHPSPPARPPQGPHPFSVASLLSTLRGAADTPNEPACAQDPLTQGRDGLGAEKSVTVFQSLFSRAMRWDR